MANAAEVAESQNPPGDLSHKGLGPETPVPAWAASKRIHFLANRSARSEAPGLEKHTSAGEEELRQYLGRRCEFLYCPQPPLRYNNGSGVQHSPVVNLIFWGGNWNLSPGSELKTQLLKMYEGLSGSEYEGILTQYFDSTGRISSSVTVNSYVDIVSPPPTLVNDEKIQEEVGTAVKGAGWSRNFDSQFVVITAPGTTFEESFANNGFCAYHGVDSSKSSYTFVPYAGDEPFKKGCAGYDKAKNVNNTTSMLASHEYAESATDPHIDEWRNSEGYELGDICISGDDELSNGAWVQGQWDDHQSSCSLGDKEPPHVLGLTEKASEVGVASATLHGTVNPEGLETKYHFEYGTTMSYGTNTPEVSAGSSLENRLVSASLSSLPHGTTYHFRIVAVNSTGTTYGEDKSFETLSLPPKEVKATAATGIATSTATFHGTVNPDSLETTYYFEYSTSELMLFEKEGTKTAEVNIGAGTSTVEVAQTVSGLAARTKYYFSITAVNADGKVTSSWLEFPNFNTWGEWSTESTPNPKTPIPATEALLEGASCASSTFCMAVGENRQQGKAFIELRNGSKWETPPFYGKEGEEGFAKGSRYGVSCPTTTTCRVVGATSSGAAAAEYWSWNAPFESWVRESQSPSSPEGSSSVTLRDISCTASSTCTAVGSYVKEGKTKTLAERYSGSWSIQTTPNPEAGSAELLGVSCNSSTSCTAIGKAGSAPYAMRWNGTSWSASSAPAPSGASESSLRKVSCTSSSNCMAVGSYKESSAPSGYQKTLFERWNGSSWSILGSPNPSGALASYLRGISCTSSSACTAVGYYSTKVEGGLGMEPKTLALSWGGAEWAIQSSPNVAGKEASMLNGVSCSAATACVGVGRAGVTFTEIGESVTLGEGYQ